MYKELIFSIITHDALTNLLSGTVTKNIAPWSPLGNSQWRQAETEKFIYIWDKNGFIPYPLSYVFDSI